MKEEGLFQEVKALYEQGYRENMPGCNAIGYKEVFAYLEGRYTEDECIEKNSATFQKLCQKADDLV